MKKTADLLDQLQSLSDRLQRELLQLEEHHYRTEERYTRLFENSAELIHLADSGPAYIRERARRLQGLLTRLRAEIGYSGKRYHSLYRQIDRMQDSIISDFFSPLIEKQMNRILRKEYPEKLTSATTLLIYRLDGMLFGVSGQVLRRYERVKPQSSIRLRNGDPLECFPERPEGLTETDRRRPGLLIISRDPAPPLGLWFDRLLEIRRKDAAELLAGVQPLDFEHRYIKGRIRSEGRTIYLIDNR